MPEYNGAPWRSRFLRGPKIGLELAAREDFVELGNPGIATVRLGLKSGNDGFFFLTRTGERTTASRVHVRGIGGWTGEVPKADLLPGVQTPKDLDTPEGRLAAVPTGRHGAYSGETYYLYPRANRLDRVVREYIQYGEQRGVHTGALVRANADDSGWYRQTRAQVTSRWALPYNSGYDYGAVDNAVGAVLNGRLVGVEPAEGVDPLVLGGILNSTFVTLMRLLEGVATGNEGAFDVGPPAARVMRIPDPRRMTDDGRVGVAAAMLHILTTGHLPHAPLADATVPDLRRELDTSVLTGLGHTKGEAAVTLDRVYRSYARWRAAVEAVEDQMQVHRRALARRGGSRTQSPIVRAANTVWNEMRPAWTPLLAEIASGPYAVTDPRFPKDEDTDQEALFDHAVVLDEQRHPLDLGDTRRVNLARFMRDLGFAGPIPLPDSPDRCQRLLAEATSAEAAFVAEASRRARAHVSDDVVDQVVTAVRRAWVNESVATVRQATTPDGGESPDLPDPSLFDTQGLVPPIH